MKCVNFDKECKHFLCLFTGQQNQAQSTAPEYNKAWGESLFYFTMSTTQTGKV